ncbi:MAG: hypothetical protein AB8B62_06480 [Roseobacter sp.]
MKGTDDDPKGLILEAYRIEGIAKSECRSIFLDWALSLPMEQDTGQTLRTLIARHAPQNPGHPMNDVMNEGLTGMATPRRRGGWRSRARN